MNIPKCVRLDHTQMNFFADAFKISRLGLKSATFYRRNPAQCCVMFATGGAQFSVIYHLDGQKNFVIDQMEAY